MNENYSYARQCNIIASKEIIHQLLDVKIKDWTLQESFPFINVLVLLNNGMFSTTINLLNSITEFNEKQLEVKKWMIDTLEEQDRFHK